MTIAAELESGLKELGLQASSAQIDQLLRYLKLMQKWNQVYSLTAIREEEKLIPYHLLDSLVVHAHLGEDSTLVDVGSGAGLPGIPLAVLRPDLNVTLLESNHKKGSFLRQVNTELALTNVSVVTERAENYHPDVKFDAAISRAFSDLKTFAQVSAGLIQAAGRLLAMKGVYPNEELEQLPSQYQVIEVARLQVPGLTAERHLVVMQAASP